MIRLLNLILESKASDDAKRQGLEYMAFGRWGKDGKVTHTTVDGKLIPVQDQDPSSTTSQNKQTVQSTQSQEPVQQSTSKGVVDGGSVSHEEFISSVPKFTEELEALAEEDEDDSYQSLFDANASENMPDIIEKWKWGGEEGEGIQSFVGEERDEIFDAINTHIRMTGVTVKAPRLYRGVSFVNNESAQAFLGQFVRGESIDLPPSGWSPNTETSMEYGVNDPSSPEISAFIELEAGDSPIRGMSTTRIERQMGMNIQHEVITPGDVKYEVREVKQITVTRDGRPQTVYKIVLRQADYVNETITSKRKHYAMLAYMGGSMGFVRNVRKKYNIKRK